MTAEVVVMNRGGVALAADSAVTIQVGDSSKVRDSAVKLFMLSKYRPVGVMVYQNSSLLGVPWETIIKLFREEFGREQCETLAEYGEALIAFLKKTDSLFTEEVQDRYYRQAVKSEYRRIETRALKEMTDSLVHQIGDRRATQQTNKAYVEQEIKRAEQLWAKEKEASYFKQVSARDVAGRNSGEVSELTHLVFGRWEIEKEDRRRLLRIAEHLVAKDLLPDYLFSGLVVAGFGESEHFPSVQHIEIGGVYGGKLKVRPRRVETVSEERPSLVLPFAYTEMVESFLDGMSKHACGHLQNAVAYIKEMPVAVLDVVPGLAPKEKAELAKIVRRASERKAAEFETEVTKGMTKRQAEIETAVGGLTIKELAQVASTLVSLSSFQQQMSLGRQTVGGPVDVAVISKGDGFIWIKRKHYFRPELNNHFFQNYYGRTSKDDAGKSSDQGATR